MDSLYHLSESLKRLFLHWLGEWIYIHLSHWALFHWKVPILNRILNKGVSYSDVIFRFLLEYFSLFSMIIALMLSWWNLSFSTTYTCPSIKDLDHSHYGKESSTPIIWYSIDILPFIICFAISPLSTLIPCTSLLQCDPCSLVVRQRSHWPDIWWHSGCWT